MICLYLYMILLMRSFSLLIQSFQFRRNIILHFLSSSVCLSYSQRMFMVQKMAIQQIEKPAQFNIQSKFSKYLIIYQSVLMRLSRNSQGSGSAMSQNNNLKNKKEKKVRKESAYRNSLLYSFFYRTETYKVNGIQSEAFNRRNYELPIESLKHVTRQNLGFTNQILCKKDKDFIQLFVPVSLTLKIKNIQQISLDELLAKIGCVLIVFIYIQGLPKEIIQHLSTKIMIQINRGQSFLLRETEESGKITFKKNKKFLTFTIRDSFPVQIYDDVFLSPFEILNLVFSITMNSTKIVIQNQLEQFDKEEKIRISNKSSSQIKKTEYNISFNSMRHPLQIPITYATDCRLGVYDLAEQLLQIYSTNTATYQETIYKFEEFISDLQEKVSKKGKNPEQNKKQQKKYQKNELKIEQKKNQLAVEDKAPKAQQSQKKKKDIPKKIKNTIQYNFFPPQNRQDEPLAIIFENKKGKKQKSVKYYQYTHFIIPLYKLPGNSFSTIFIPMFMLSLLSIFIFLQRTGSFQEQIGSIATFVLGFIALIPSIKDQLPPSQKITLSQIIIYVQSVNCMLSLLDKYWNIGRKPMSILKNKLFVISMIIHLVCFLVAFILLLLHYFVWQKRYNLNKQPTLSSPSDNFKAWNNPYCDQEFLAFNQSARKQKKYDNIIVPWPIENLEKIKKQYLQQEV